MEVRTQVFMESPLGYHPLHARNLTVILTVSGTVAGGQFDWGGRLRKSNGGAQRYPQNGWKPFEESKVRRVLDCETNKSSRYESRA